jgi:hypothetical protein
LFFVIVPQYKTILNIRIIHNCEFPAYCLHVAAIPDIQSSIGYSILDFRQIEISSDNCKTELKTELKIT